MTWLLTSALWVAFTVTRLLSAYVLFPLAKLAIAYLWYMCVAIGITVLIKIRYEVFNKDLKLKPSQIKGRTLLITGAGSGIGLALVRHFLRRRFTIVACYYTKDEPGYEELMELSSNNVGQGQKLFLVQLDVRSQESISSCHTTVESIMAKNPELKLHALVNVAGIGVLQKFQWTPKETIRNIVETNLTGPMLMTREFLHLLIKTPDSRVINVASPLGITPLLCSGVYGPTKAGLAHFTSVLERDIARYDVKTVTIQPGNLMRYTPIIHQCLSQRTAGVVKQLSEDEKLLYKHELDEHEKWLGTVARIHEGKKRFVDLKFGSKLAILIDGGLVEDRLQDSISFFRSFENSVCLKNPPREMFSGNMLFNLLVSSVFQWTPRVLLRDLVLSVQKHLQVGINVR